MGGRKWQARSRSQRSGDDALAALPGEEMDARWPQLGPDRLAQGDRQVRINPRDDRRRADVQFDEGVRADGLHQPDYADLNGIPLAIHNNGSAMNTVAEAHLAAACPNFIGLEYHFWDAKWIGQVVRREGVPLFDDAGHVPLTDAPGFGVEIDLAIAERYLAPGESLF